MEMCLWAERSHEGDVEVATTEGLIMRKGANVAACEGNVCEP